MGTKHACEFILVVWPLHFAFLLGTETLYTFAIASALSFIDPGRHAYECGGLTASINSIPLPNSITRLETSPFPRHPKFLMCDNFKRCDKIVLYDT
ncbi:uncharacterized protein PHALS_06297 [Plasmopara halstedii]|uniref:Uncharacterized protein n=1 Tax=Plasmopara halstedii TaxID=4781 RepID=A0A0P1B4U9_PLAHL|nr:uncharacterized protein PHALS_06297 [Plasmopara halstedii]CEG48477.1 hypothetical protein PHALS_06297 [Plasmopara halstedii]|eukprot:XP_024584846.1 hypothetical protein PHALS_06297 [Plasmopara halstedii]